MIMKPNETQEQDEQLRRLAGLWPTLTPAVRRSIVALVEGSIELRKLNRGAGGVRPHRMDNILHTENHYDYGNE